MTSDPVSAVVLAAGEGRRLSPLTTRRPKPMLPVANQPILEHVVEAITAAGIDRIVLVVGYRDERIRSHFGDGREWGIDIDYVEQGRQLGTGHAVLQAEAAVGEPFLVLNGDRIVDASIVERVWDAALTEEAPVMAVTRVDRPREYGVVELDGGRVVSIAEKPEAPVDHDRINAGVYGFSTDIFDAIREVDATGELALTDALNALARERPIAALEYDGRWLDVSRLPDLLTVNAALLDARSEGGRSPDHATVADGAVLGADVRLGAGAVVGERTALGENVRVGATAIVENAVVMPDATIESGAIVRDAVVASNARVGANATISGGRTTVEIDGEVAADVRLGAVLGDNATVTGGVTMAPGSIVGDGVRVESGGSFEASSEAGGTVRSE